MPAKMRRAIRLVFDGASCAVGCHGCGVHGHAHARVWFSNLPAPDVRSFFGALGCSCCSF